MTTIKQAQQKLSQITKRRGDLEKKKASLDITTIDQELGDTDAEMEAQQAEIAELQRQKAYDDLAKLRTRVNGLFAEYGALAERLDTIKGDADKLVTEISELTYPFRKLHEDDIVLGVGDINVLRSLSWACETHGGQIRADKKAHDHREGCFKR